MSSPAKRRRSGWEVVNGAVDEGETLIDAAQREVREEVGPGVRLGPLSVVDAWTWRYDDVVTEMISIAFVATYLGGDVRPGDDMVGSEVRWATLEEVRVLARSDVLLIPELSVFEKALLGFDSGGGAS